MRLIIEAGAVYGRLAVMAELAQVEKPSGGYNRVFLCLCECGQKKAVRMQHLRSGRIKSCGCLHDETHKTHAKSNTIEYRAWIGIKSRCLNKNSAAFQNYGARGISISDNWINSFDAFYADMGDCPQGNSIDRIDNDGNYEKSNCRWATRHEQSRNTSRNIMITFKGATLPLVDWASKLNIPYYRLRNRIKVLGWPVDRAFSETTTIGWTLTQ